MGEINEDELLKILKDRFEAHRERHPDISWDRVEIRINENSKALESLAAMEAHGEWLRIWALKS